MPEDRQLLQRYIEEASEPAFTELVRRHVDLVYSVAMRVLNGDAPLAQDTVQKVFSDLARKARQMPEDVILGGWLYRHAFYVAAQAVRAERRRQTRERHAADMNLLNETTDASWEQIAPFLDEAMQQLDPGDHDAIVLRYFAQRDLRAVGAALGLSEEAARKRISRALEKLRQMFTQKGFTLSGAILATMLSTKATVAAPVGLVPAIIGPALAGAVGGAGTAFGVFKLIGASKVKVGAISSIAAAGLAIPLLFQHQAIDRLQQENRALIGQIDQLGQLRIERDRLDTRLAQAEKTTLSQEQFRELMRLRGEVAVLRRRNEEVAVRLSDFASAGTPITAVVSGTELTGKVRLKGQPPPEVPLPLEANCGKTEIKPRTTRHYLVGAEGGLGNVFVYLKEGVAKQKGIANAPAILEETGCQFEPYVSGLMVGQKLLIRNLDPVMHTVHSMPTNNPGFSLAQTAKGQEGTATFGKPEILIRIKCDVYPWMFAYLSVVEHSYFAVTDTNGMFRISNVPPGRYTIEAVHLKAGASTQKVVVDEDAASQGLEFTLEVKR